MKALTLINPRPRKRRRATKRRTTRRNPTRRKATGYTVGSVKKRPIRRRKLNPARRRRATARRRYLPARRKTRRNPVVMRNARRRRRRSPRRNPFSLGSMVTRDMVMMAAGGVATGFINDAILNSTAVQKLKLPGINNNFGDAVYRLLIPMGASAVLRRFGGRSMKPFARGLVLGGLINSLGAIVGLVNTKVAGTGEYFPALFANNSGQRKAVAPVGATPGYSATSRFSGVGGAFDGERAFPADAWSN